MGLLEFWSVVSLICWLIWDVSIVEYGANLHISHRKPIFHGLTIPGATASINSREKMSHIRQHESSQQLKDEHSKLKRLAVLEKDFERAESIESEGQRSHQFNHRARPQQPKPTHHLVSPSYHETSGLSFDQTNYAGFNQTDLRYMLTEKSQAKMSIHVEAATQTLYDNCKPGVMIGNGFGQRSNACTI